MKYLQLSPVRDDDGDLDEWPTYAVDQTRSRFDFYYIVPEDGFFLVRNWAQTPIEDDPLISGILADYLDENRSLLLDGATGPSDPAERLDRLIHYLRQRCVSTSGV